MKTNRKQNKKDYMNYKNRVMSCRYNSKKRVMSFFDWKYKSGWSASFQEMKRIK